MPISPDELFGAAPYLADLRRIHADWDLSFEEEPPDQLLAALIGDLTASGKRDERATADLLRVTKGKVALLAAVAETAGAWTTAQACAALADFADAALDAGLQALLQRSFARGEFAREVSVSECGLGVFALGKHGGRELNYSSDIDIVAFFDREQGVLADPDDATRVYSRIVQRLAAMLEDRVGGRYVFRTDLRLRPDPSSTPMALSTDAALVYYESRGQNWERAAWIKARPCAGDREVGASFLAELAPYIWRKHLDFATIADIEAMKRQINISKNVGFARVAGHNVKLGRGGIREVEFFAQTQQLIAGGRDRNLRVRPTTMALSALAEAGWISTAAANELTGAYWFLRAVENRLQMRRDEQTHTMPETEEGVATIASLMGYDEPQAFEAAYRSALETVQRHYANLFREGETLAAAGGDLVFTGGDDDPGTVETLGRLGFADAAAASATIRKWHYGGYRATRAAAARAQLTELLPTLLTTISRTGNADLALNRFDQFLARLPSGVQLFSLLSNHDSLRDLLIRLLASAPRLANAVAQRVHVVDAFIDPAFADEIARPAVLAAKVDSFLADARDYGELIDRARIIGQEQKFLIAVGLLSATVTADQAAEQFTTLAETLLQRMFAAVRTEFEMRHGRVAGSSVALLAFGKMASREMTASSDLDFILLYDAPEDAVSDGERSLAASQYFARLTQRLIAAVTAPTAEGVLYQADMRLRPSGNSGPLATSLRAFELYQEQSAWTWEHLALTRTRLIAADPDLAIRVERIIRETLLRSRDRPKTIADVVSMRALMLRERPARHQLDLKLVDGGLTDLEFIAQSAQLVAGSTLALGPATTRAVLRRLAETGLLEAGERLATIHETYTTVLQVMSAALSDPFEASGWTDSFRDLLAQLSNAPNYQRLVDDLAAMEAEVAAAARDWYQQAESL